jgi:polysaccharide biosynthesis/export protein
MIRRLSLALGAAFSLLSPAALHAQVPTTRPTSAQAQAALSDPTIRNRVLAQVKASGMSPDQIRSSLRSMGYGDDVISQLIGGPGVDTTAAFSDEVFAAVRALGIMDSTAVDSLRAPVLQRRKARAIADSALLDSLAVAIKNDSVRAAVRRLMNSPASRRVGIDSGFNLFGRDIFERQTTQFDPVLGGPLPPSYRVGSGDQFMLLLTGGVERTENLVVTRDGWVVLRDVGQVPAANLTFEQLQTTLRTRLGNAYSGIRTGETRFSLLPTKVGTNQVFVLGSVTSPNAYQISRLGTVLTALYAAGGPGPDGDARTIDVKRNGEVIATMDLYDYLITGSSKSDIVLENGDVVFVRPEGPRVRVTGAVVRPATYELTPGESLADAIRMAGGLRAEADRRRVQIERIVPPSRRTASGQDKEVLDVPAENVAASNGPQAQKLESGDVVRVFAVDRRISNMVRVVGNVWQPAAIALTSGMKLSDALARAGGLKPDTYLGVLQLSRLLPDSTRQLTRVVLDRDFRPLTDLTLAPDDEIKAFSLTEYRTDRYVTIGGSVRQPQRVPFQEGITLRDLILFAGGLQESALLTEAEIASLPHGNRSNRVTALTRRVPLDSSYLLETGTGQRNSAGASSAEVVLQPYDAVTILQQPGFSYQRSVWVTGEVKYAGQYSLKSKDERLADLIGRAGGLTPDAYAAGVSFIRQRDSVGRIGVNLTNVLRNSRDRDNLLLSDGDSIFIPTYSPIVTVRGEVNSPNISVAHVPGADIDYYLKAAGRATTKGDEQRAYVVQPNGKVESRSRHVFLIPSDPTPEAGSSVVVPIADPTRRRDWIAIAQTTLGLMTSMVTVAVLIRSR